MTPLQLRFALNALGWTQQRLADELELSVRTVNGYVNRGPIPKWFALAVKQLKSTRNPEQQS